MDFSCSQTESQNSKLPVHRRRSWTEREEDFLIECFQEILTTGWKSDNGFKTSFLMQLECKMKMKMPGTDLRGDPHINSKYGTWKKAYRDVTDALAFSRLNWCSGTKKFVALPNVWDDLIAAHPHIRSVREKSFFYYEQWGEIFGKDTACGVKSKQYPDDPKTKTTSAHTIDLESDPDSPPAATPSPGNDRPTQYEYVAPKNPTPTANDSKKRKRAEAMEDLTECITSCWSKATESMDRVASRMGHDKDQTEARKNLGKLIGDLPIILNRAQKLKACHIIGHDQETLDMFRGYDEDEQVEVVKQAIDGTLGL